MSGVVAKSLTGTGVASDQEVAWTPSQAYLDRSRLRRFMARHDIATYDDLLARATADPAWYWGAVAEDLDLTWSRPYEQVLDLSRGAPWAEWFTGGGFNYVTSALDRHAAGPGGERTALIWEGDDGAVRRLTFRELQLETNRLANALRQLGVERGDRVGVFMPMLPETVAAVLALGKLGAIFLPMFSGFGPEALGSRLHDGEASLLITVDGALRRGKTVPMKAVADEAMTQAPSVRTCLVLRRTGEDVPWTAGRDVWWHDVVPEASPDFATVETAANEPYMLIYTSGTTGRPKGAVHVHAGFPVKAAHDLATCFDLQHDDTLFWLTDLGWMMGPWLICGGLIVGATLMLFEGTPDYPDPDRLWRLVEDHRVTILGVAPTAVRALMGKGTDWVRKRDRSSLRILGSTGETWNPGPWRWYFEEVGEGRCPDHQLLGRDGDQRRHRRLRHAAANRALWLQLPGAGDGRRRDRQRRPSGARRGWGAGRAPALGGYDSRLLARPGTLSRDLLEPHSRSLGAWRLGGDRRQRPMVHPRAFGRHLEGGGETGRTGRGGVGGDGAPRRAGGRRDRRAA